MKTARFADLVKQAGAPETYLLWAAPKQDRVFQRAVKEQRILAVQQANVGSRKDFGRVGFHDEPQAQYLVFPRSLRPFADRRVIGINYDLLAKESRPGPAPKIEPRKHETKSVKRSVEPSLRNRAAPSREDEADSNLVAFAPSKPQAPRPKKENAPKEKEARGKRNAPVLDPDVLRVVRRAMKELDAGKTVAAYKRLEALVEATKAGDEA